MFKWEKESGPYVSGSRRESSMAALAGVDWRCDVRMRVRCFTLSVGVLYTAAHISITYRLVQSSQHYRYYYHRSYIHSSLYSPLTLHR